MLRAAYKRPKRVNTSGMKNKQLQIAKPGPERLLLSAKEVGQVLSLARSTVFVMHSAGKLPAPVRPTGGDPRWRADEIAAWVQAGCPARDAWERSKR